MGIRIASEPPDLTGVTADGGLRDLLGKCLAKFPHDSPTLAGILASLTELAPEDPPDDLAHAGDTGREREPGHNKADLPARPYLRTQTVDRAPAQKDVRRVDREAETDSHVAAATTPPPGHRRSRRAQPRLPRSSGRRRWPIVATALAVLVAVVFGGGYIFYRVSQEQYYVAADSGGQVVIYRGISQHIAGFSWSSPYETTGIELSQVPSSYQQTVKTAYSTGSLTQARSTVTDIRDAVDNCRNAYAALENWAAAVNRYNIAVAQAHKAKRPTNNIPKPGAQPAAAGAMCPSSVAFAIPASALAPATAGSS